MCAAPFSTSDRKDNDMSNTKKPSGAALHEAAHAVVGLHYQWPVRSAGIRRDHEGGVLWDIRDGWHPSHTPFEEQLDVYAAGYAVEPWFTDAMWENVALEFSRPQEGFSELCQISNTALGVAMRALLKDRRGPVSSDDVTKEAIVEVLRASRQRIREILDRYREGYLRLARALQEQKRRRLPGHLVLELANQGRKE